MNAHKLFLVGLARTAVRRVRFRNDLKPVPSCYFSSHKMPFGWCGVRRSPMECRTENLFHSSRDIPFGGQMRFIHFQYLLGGETMMLALRP